TRSDGALPGQSGDIAEVAGHHRQHARGQEGHQARRGGDGHGQQQRSGQCGGLEGLSYLGDVHSASTRSIIERSVEGSIAPETRAATLPARSISRVVGTAFGATCPRRAYMISASRSGREG